MIRIANVDDTREIQALIGDSSKNNGKRCADMSGQRTFWNI